MNFSPQSHSTRGFRRLRPPSRWRNTFGRLRASLSEAVRAYSEALVCRALTIEPGARERLEVDVHFCDLR